MLRNSLLRAYTHDKALRFFARLNLLDAITVRRALKNTANFANARARAYGGVQKGKKKNEFTVSAVKHLRGAELPFFQSLNTQKNAGCNAKEWPEKIKKICELQRLSIYLFMLYTQKTKATFVHWINRFPLCIYIENSSVQRATKLLLLQILARKITENQRGV